MEEAVARPEEVATVAAAAATVVAGPQEALAAHRAEKVAEVAEEEERADAVLLVGAVASQVALKAGVLWPY